VNRLRIRAERVIAGAVAAAVLAACGGGGGGGGTGGPPPPGAASVTGDMLAYQANRGWNYHGTIQGTAVTVSVYADPQQNGVDPLIGFAGTGTGANAFGATKIAGLGVQNTGSGYVAGSYILLNTDGSVYASGSIPGTPTLVPSTLTQGASFNTYPGVTAVVQSVGTVPGASNCPAPATGATVQYTFQGQTYSVSYVPGCGITQYVGNHGETLTLASVGTYQLGTQSVRRMDTLTAMDTIKSAARVLMSQTLWRPFPH
jgi:hypothetical protein